MYSEDCEHFGLSEPEFKAYDEVKQNIEHYENTWGQFEEFNTGLQDLVKEDWISFRFLFFNIILSSDAQQSDCNASV